MKIKVYEYCIEQLGKDNTLKPEDYFLLGCIVGDRGVARLTNVSYRINIGFEYYNHPQTYSKKLKYG